LGLKIIHGNNIERLKEYPDNYFDSVVTDPPYGLGKEPNAEELMKDWVEKGYHEIKGTGFMGKEWDAFVPQPIFWKEVFRVLKPGGHILSFFGTRTYDWGVMAMRFAGFEVRDTIYWHYGSGFPKSHNISKAIDKMGGESLDWFIDYVLKVAEEKNISKKELTMLFPSKNGNPTGWLWNKHNNQSITIEQYNKIKDYLGLDFPTIEEAKREIVGVGKAGLTKGSIANFSGDIEFDITAPATEEAKKWDGWGSALKPATEPIVLARKPLEKGLSIAENVLKWGTGAINIDGCRISGIDINNAKRLGKDYTTENTNFGGGHIQQRKLAMVCGNLQGRFPANLILTHHPECECVGIKKVKSVSNYESKDGYESESVVFNGKLNSMKSDGYADENGEETIEDWKCHNDCPIKIMDEQSGNTKSSKSAKLYVNDTEGRSVKNGASGFRDPNSTYSDSGGASRFFYVAKASKSERNRGLEGFEEKEMGRNQSSLDGGKMLTGSGNERSNTKKNFHPTVKPVKLMQYLVRLVTHPNGIVLDPFCGSGTTGIACKLEGFDFVGMEQDEEYSKIAIARIENYCEKKEQYESIEVKKEENKQEITQLKIF
jgi:DNA modification methylase